MFEVRSYHDYISPELAAELLKRARPVPGVPNLFEVGEGGGLETSESLKFLTEIYDEISGELTKILDQRVRDRAFIDERVRACSEYNKKLGFAIDDRNFKSVIGLEDAKGRVVFGPLTKKYASPGGKKVADIPDYLKGAHVTLFGPPDSEKMAINAMNAYHRKIKGEPPIVAELLAQSKEYPKWGADDEDSKTPLRADLVDAAVNLTRCFEGTLRVKEEGSGKTYELAGEKLSLPIKRFPGLAMPSPFLFYRDNPIPLHLYDFALHVFKNWQNEQALVFYVPKLENEEEAKYIHKMIECTERRIKNFHPEYKLGTVRLMIVLENPRAILRTHEIIDALYPYFVGASLGWHDYLASMARLYKEEEQYRIPVKADPDIVIKYIKASHLMLSDVVGSRGGIKVGGMYGILPLDNDIWSVSFQMTLKGFFKDVIVQMKRDLTGFWVAHPDFVRLGIAIVEAWRLHRAGKKAPLEKLIKSLLAKNHQGEIFRLIKSKDFKGLNPKSEQYVRSLIVADIKESDFIANNDAEEIRYNVFQSLQYLTDWLAGNGCVALPAIVNGVPVRVMDDLATAERSRWEVWAELYHGRFSLIEFLKIAHEELNFIRRDLSNSKKIVQVKWNDKTEKWYPVAFQLMLLLMTRKNPPEFATELLLPFTVEAIRKANDPIKAIKSIDKGKYNLDEKIARFNFYFEACGEKKFADQMSEHVTPDWSLVEAHIRRFSVSEIRAAASFHGNIGESQKTLDAHARGEQAKVFAASEGAQSQLLQLGEQYKKKFGFKFLISAKGKSADELGAALKARMKNSRLVEIDNARAALAEIALKRLKGAMPVTLFDRIENLRREFNVDALSVAINHNGHTQSLALGSSKPETYFELASLSKVFASAFCIDYFRKNKISLTAKVNGLLKECGSKFQLTSAGKNSWADDVEIRHLLNHTALNMHYVKGVPKSSKMPNVANWLKDITVITEPGTRFQYSGGGFLVLEHLIEGLEKSSVDKITASFLNRTTAGEVTFQQTDQRGRNYAIGHFDDGKTVESGRYLFPAFAAGAMGTSRGVAHFLSGLTHAYNNLNSKFTVSHDTSVEMLHGEDLGSKKFMGGSMGLGVFVIDAGDSKWALHQGANEGFRALFLQCFSGPDAGKGFVIFANGDNKAVVLVARIAQEILKELKVSSVDVSKFQAEFNSKNLEQAQIVNLGYKELVFNAFLPTKPEAIVRSGPVDDLTEYNVLIDAQVIDVSNDRFARAENLISAYRPTFDPELFGRQGKIMDSWESSRHNPRKADYVELALKSAVEIQYFKISTEYHLGNQAKAVRVLGKNKVEEEWIEFLPVTELEGHSNLKIKLSKVAPAVKYLRVEMLPDGGLSRLAAYSSLPESIAKEYLPLETAKCEWAKSEIPKTKKPLTISYRPIQSEIRRNIKSVKKKSEIDWASQAFGGTLLRATNEHYGPAIQVISPFAPIHMFDGLESARSRDAGHFEEVILKLGRKIIIREIVFDFKYFVNNNPNSIRVEGKYKGRWVELVPNTNVKPFAANQKSFKIQFKAAIQDLRVITLPDGGINRIHVYSR